MHSKAHSHSPIFGTSWSPANVAFTSQLTPLFLIFLFLFVTLAAQPATAQALSVLYTFTGGADGASPLEMIMDAAGNLYGVTLSGGTGSCSIEGIAGCGTIFELKKHNSSYTFNSLYSFQGGTDGEAPQRPLTLGPNGTYYGTTFGGGEGTCNYEGILECGVVFNAGANPTPPRTPLLKFRENVLYRFSGGSDGANPVSTVVFDKAGNIYGTTSSGGEYGHGSVFELSPARGGTYTETVLYSFCPVQPPFCPDGAGPDDGVIFDNAGNLYGTTVSGGSYGNGAVFELSPSGVGWTESLLHSFEGENDGRTPESGLAMDTAGNLYGNTSFGGSGGNGGGTVYELGLNGFNVLYSLASGYYSAADRVTLDSSGNLYETVALGGFWGCGQVLELANTGGNWTYIDLWDFTGSNDGCNPSGSVVLDSSGNLYGTAEGGNNGYGVVWEITP